MIKRYYYDTDTEFDELKKKKYLFDSLFDFCQTNQGLEKEKFIEELKKSFKKCSSIDDFYKFIEYGTRFLSSNKGVYIKNVFDKVIKGIEPTVKPNVSTFNINMSEEKRLKEKAKHDEMINNLKKDMDDFIANPDPEKKKDKNFLGRIKYYVSELESEKVVDFLIKYYELSPIELKDVDEFKEVLEYFVANLKKTKEEFEMLDPVIDKDRIYGLVFKGEEELNSSIRNDANKLRSWKFRHCASYEKFYTELIEILDKFKTNASFESFTKLGKTAETRIALDEEFVINEYKKLRDMATVYNSSISKNVYTNKAKTEEIKSLFTKKLILKNNIDNK